MAGTFATYGKNTARRVLRDIAELKRRPYGGGSNYNQAFVRGPLVTRWGKTTTNYYYPTYPTTGRCVVVTLGDLESSNDQYVPGSGPTLEFTEYDPTTTVIAVADKSPLPFEDTVVPLYWANGVWWFREPATRKAILDASCAIESSAAASIYINDADAGTRTVHYNWMTSGMSTIPSGTEIIVEWFDDESKWVIVAAACPS